MLALASLAAVTTARCTGGEEPSLPPLPTPPAPVDRRAERPPYTAARPGPLGASSFSAAFERGLAAYNSDDPDGAADAFEEAVRLAPDDPEAHINLGLVYLRLRRADDGLRELNEGARLQHERSRTHEQRVGDDPPAGRRVTR